MAEKESSVTPPAHEDFNSLPKDLFRLWLVPFSEDIEPPKLLDALRERIKELNCLYGIAQLAERHSNSIENLLQELVTFLPFSWQYPEITRARIVFKGKTYKSKGFRVTQWRQSSRIFMYNEPVGEVSIFYLRECPPADEGPFLREERILLDALAGRIGTTATRISAEQELQELNKQLIIERKALQEANSALRAILARIEEEKQEIYKDIRANVDKILMPILTEMALHLPETYKKYAEILKTNLEDIASPFVNHLSKAYLSLTSTEVSICNMIQNGLQTKEIARIRGVSVGTINRHREHIRRKLNITNSDVNLMTYLQSNMWSKG
ncbi:MAG: LuxR C-terminal-related transcriptional regulator [Desulfatiglans sp.]|jgi:DNA-binding NarL/FixJ family response regulator|nr:LuxR C-terminal-related transcriptional regulator [Desulfatiglans sp.]